MRQYHDYKDLLVNNARWASEKKVQSPGFFEKLAEYQNPPFLFLGCSDSRVPIDTFTQTDPGELFIHRNVGNQVSLTDMNFLSVLQYALEVLKVKHVIVAGHYECGGIQAACCGGVPPLVENWVNPILEITHEHKQELEAITDERQRLNRVEELNVIVQVKNIFRVSFVSSLIRAGGYYPQIHGWILDIGHGLIKELPLPLEQWKAQGIVPQNY